MSLSKLSDHTGYWLRLVSNAVSHEFARKVAGQDVTVAEWVLLRALHDLEPSQPSALAAEMGLTKGAISKLAERLEAKGLVVRTAITSDKRAHELSLTPEGRRKVPVLAALADANDVHFFGLLSAEDHETLRRILMHLAERADMVATPID